VAERQQADQILLPGHPQDKGVTGRAKVLHNGFEPEWGDEGTLPRQLRPGLPPEFRKRFQ
jgi:hypothetical protein